MASWRWRRRSLVGVLALGGLAIWMLLPLVQGGGRGGNPGQARGTAHPGAGARAAPALSRPSPVVAPPPGGWRQVVARRDLPAVTLLTTTTGIATSFREVPAAAAPPADGFATPDALVAYVRAARGGRYTMVPLLAGTLLRRGALGDLGGRSAAGVALRLPRGRVAESVTVPPLQSADAAIVVGDQVDVLLTLSTDQLSSFRAAGQPAGPQETQQLLQHVLVVATDPPVYTLALLLQEALLLKYVKDSANATIELVPCSSQDTTEASVRTLPILPESFGSALASAFRMPRRAQGGVSPSVATGRVRGHAP